MDERRGLPRSRWWLRAAASIGIFAAGAASGILTMRGADSASVGSAEGLSGDEPLALAAEVQRTGSEYVAALAALTAADNSLPESARLQGRDVAWATLRGAVSHLAALGEGGEPGAERSFGVRSVTDEGRVRF